jgi:hypothetical protein
MKCQKVSCEKLIGEGVGGIYSHQIRYCGVVYEIFLCSKHYHEIQGNEH